MGRDEIQLREWMNRSNISFSRRHRPAYQHTAHNITLRLSYLENLTEMFCETEHIHIWKLTDAIKFTRKFSVLGSYTVLPFKEQDISAPDFSALALYATAAATLHSHTSNTSGS